MFNSIIQYFTPKGKKLFFPLFDSAAHNVVEMATLLNDALHNGSKLDTKDLFHKIDRLENIGDDITHHINIELGKNFITPFDREDIHALTSSIDDVADYIHESSNRMFLYDLQEITKPMQILGEHILQAALKMQTLIDLLKDITHVAEIVEYSEAIYEIETQADQIYNRAVAELFEQQKHDPISVIKYQEILLGLETATDMSRDVVKVVESIMIKNG